MLPFRSCAIATPGAEQPAADQPLRFPGPREPNLSVSRGGASRRPGDGILDSGAPDDELVSAARDGDRDAFAMLYRRYARTVHGVLLSRTPATDVEDLLHDVFLKAMRKLHRLRDGNSFGAWICTIARNQATDHLRRRRKVEPLTEPATEPRDDWRVAEEILEVIQTLPEAYREPLILRLVEQMPGPQIALRTGMTTGSVRVNLHRGMKLLRERLKLEEERP